MIILINLYLNSYMLPKILKSVHIASLELWQLGFYRLTDCYRHKLQNNEHHLRRWELNLGYLRSKNAKETSDNICETKGAGREQSWR